VRNDKHLRVGNNPMEKRHHFVYLGKTSRPVPPIRRNARYDPMGKRDLRMFDRTDITDTYEMTQISKKDYEDFLETGTVLDIEEDQYLDAAFEEAAEAFALPHKVPCLALDAPGWETICQQMDMSSTSGYPHFKKQGEIIDDIYHEAHQLGHFMKYKDYKDLIMPPCYLAMKPGKFNKLTGERKYREIFEYPAAIKVNEMRFTLPLYTAYHGLPLRQRPILSGDDPRSMTEKYFLSQVFPHKYALKTDFSTFNRNVAVRLINYAFSIIADNIDFGGYPYSHGHAKRNWKQFCNLASYFINTPFVLPNGEIYRKKSGVPSGSGFTLLVNSIVTRIVINACLMKLTGSLVTDIKTTGDDCSCGLDTEVDLKVLGEYALHYRMVLNPTKQVCTERSSPVMKGFKLLGYIGFPYRIRFDDTVLWENVYLTKNYVLTNHDHMARIYSLWLLSDGQSYEFDTLYDTCLVKYTGRQGGAEIVMKPTNTFRPTGTETILGKLTLDSALNEMLKRNLKCGLPKAEPQQGLRKLKYYMKIAEEAIRKYYFKHRRELTQLEMDRHLESLLSSKLTQPEFENFQPIH